MSALYNLVVEQGATLEISFSYQNDDGTPIDITGFDAHMQIRESHQSATVLAEYLVGDGLTLTVAEGKVTLRIEETESQAWDWRSGVYDLELIEPDGDVIRLVEGKVTVTPEVTR